MKNKNLKTRNIRKITIGLFSLLFLTGTASAAHYRVTIDCNHSSISNTDTTNRITASFLDRNRSVIRRVSKTGITNCARNEAGFSINSERTLGYVEFSTNGNDAYYIDEWRLFVDGRLVKRTGTDNARGWCLSTDPGDARGPWQRYVTGGCRSRIRFPVSVSTVPTGNRAYRLTVDCSHSSITNTDTTNRITAAFLDENRRVIRRVAKNGIRNCQSSGAAFSINTNRTVRYVEFNTNGNDAFYIDDWRLYLNGRQIKRGGTNNARGWCLSTDPNDAGGLWRPFVSGRCRTRIRFPITSVPTPPTTGNQVYRVTVDCYHSKIRFTDTTNRITVAFLDAGRNVIRRVSKSGIRNCSGSEAAFSIRTNRRVRYIEFSTNGNDGFFIDEWRLFLDGRQIQHLGVDDGRGWCLSTDPGDAGGPWSGFVTGGCKSRLRFL